MIGRTVLFAAFAFSCTSLATQAQQANHFYQGKQLTLLINLSAGGPTDTEARLLARHLGKHIAGNPTIVPRIMTGAGGIVAANWLGQVAPADGLNLGFFSSVASASSMAVPSLKIDITKLAFAGTGSGVSVSYARRDTGGGLASPEDLMKKSNVWIGGLAIDSDKDLRMRLQLDLLAMPYKYVTGYPGAADIRLAVQRGEVQMTSESMPSYRAAVEPAMVEKGEVMPMWFDHPNEAKAARPHEAADIDAVSFYDYFKRVKGKAPEGFLWDAFDTMNTVARGYERILVMAPNTPKEALADVQRALRDLTHDEEFHADALKTMKFVPEYDTSAEAETIYRGKVAPNTAFVSFFEKYIEEGKAQSARK
jgi:tripartite-type tricarboxylate transporter receptor subunit TctC